MWTCCNDPGQWVWKRPAIGLAAALAAGCGARPQPPAPSGAPVSAVRRAPAVPVQVTELPLRANPNPTLWGPRAVVDGYLQAAAQRDGHRMRDLMARPARRRAGPRTLASAARGHYSPDASWQIQRVQEHGRTASVQVALNSSSVSPNPFPFVLDREQGKWRVAESPELPSRYSADHGGRFLYRRRRAATAERRHYAVRHPQIVASPTTDPGGTDSVSPQERQNEDAFVRRVEHAFRHEIQRDEQRTERDGGDHSDGSHSDGGTGGNQGDNQQ